MKQEELNEKYLYVHLYEQHVISKKTLLEKIGIDAEDEVKRIEEEQVAISFDLGKKSFDLGKKSFDLGKNTAEEKGDQYGRSSC